MVTESILTGQIQPSCWYQIHQTYQSHTVNHHKYCDSLPWTMVPSLLTYLLHCVSKNAPTLKQYSSKLSGLILMTFGLNVQKTLEWSLHVSVFG